MVLGKVEQMPYTREAKRAVVVFITFIAFAAVPFVVVANPVLDHVASGNVSISQTSSTTTVQQQSSSAIIQWNTFNIGPQQTTHFQQPANGITLNRINPSNGVSQILGTLNATGKIILVNQAGIFFGPSAHVDVGGIIASTSDISNENFNAGKYIFDHASEYSGASIINEGLIKIASFGLVALVGSHVRNDGIIEAKLGNIVLASGSKFTVSFDGSGLINFVIDAPADSHAKVTNTGKLIANGGTILVTAQAAQNTLDDVINMKGIAIAHSVSSHGGVINIDGGSSGIVRISGKLIASSKKQSGGNIQVSGDKIHLAASAVLNADGALGGGTIKLSSNSMTDVRAGAILSANATQYGNGGHISVLSGSDTEFHGALLAQGGLFGGNGGFAETSGYLLNVSGATVNLASTSGAVGNWLLDPADLTICASCTTTASFSSNTYSAGSTNSNLLVTDLINALNSANVVVQTSSSGTGGNGDIFVNTAIAWSSGNTLTLTAYRNITLAAAITNTGGGNLVLRTDNSGTGIGTVTGGSSNNNVTLSGGSGTVSIYYNPTTFGTQNTLYTGGTTPIQYMLIQSLGTATDAATVNSLGALSNNSSLWVAGENYALANNINASATGGGAWNGTSGFSPIGSTSFAGLFDGQGFTISNLTINRSATNTVALFGSTASTAIIQNLNLTSEAVTGSSTVGGLVANNAGKIINSSAAVTLSSAGGTVGGLVGTSSGSINNSSSSGTITVSSSSKTNFGGLVGINSGSVSNSFSTATINVNGNSNSDIGGFIGQNASAATLSNDYSTGSIAFNNTSGNSTVGGFIGLNSMTTALSGSGNNVGPCTGSICSTGSITAATGSAPGTVGGFIGSNSAPISNIVVNSSVSVIGSSFVGGLIGNNSGSVSNSTAAATVTLLNGGSNVGGFIGNNSGVISNSSSSGNVTNTTNAGSGSSGQTGGFIGDNVGNISNSFSTGTVSITGNHGNFSNIGGFIGRQDGGTLTNAYSSGNIIFNNTATNNGIAGVGGFIGSYNTSVLLNGGGASYGPCPGSICAIGNMIIEPGSGVASAVGGFIGGTGSSTATVIENVTNIYTSVSGFNNVGGFVGTSFASILNSTSTTNVIENNGVNALANDTFRFGGFMGVYRATTGPLTNDSSSGTVTINDTNVSQIGGFMGQSGGTGAMSNLSTTSNIIFNVAASSDTDVGGFVGINLNTGIITASNVVNNNSIVFPSNAASLPTNIGGFAGENDGKIQNVSSTTGMSVSGGNNVGGFVGLNTGTLINNSTNNSPTGTNDVGALVGNASSASSISSSSSSGNATGFQNVSNLIGLNSGTITSSTGTGTAIFALSSASGPVSVVFNNGNSGSIYISGTLLQSFANLGGITANSSFSNSLSLSGGASVQLTGSGQGTMNNSISFSNFSTINGSSSSLTLPNGSSTLYLTGANQGYVNSTSFLNLSGFNAFNGNSNSSVAFNTQVSYNAANNTAVMNGATMSFANIGNITGNSNFSNSLILGSSSPMQLTGSGQGIINNTLSFNNFHTANGSNSSLTLPGAASTLYLTGANQGYVNSTSFLSFNGINTINGNSNTSLVFSAAGIYNPSYLTATINGATMQLNGITTTPSGLITAQVAPAVNNAIVSTVVSTTIPPTTPFAPSPSVMMANIIADKAAVNTNINAIMNSLSSTPVDTTVSSTSVNTSSTSSASTNSSDSSSSNSVSAGSNKKKQ